MANSFQKHAAVPFAKYPCPSLAANLWITSLRRSGAKHLNLWTEEGLQQMTFGMDLKNLWSKNNRKASIGVRVFFWLRGGNIWLDIYKGCVYKPCRMTTFYMHLSKVLGVIQIDPLHARSTSKWYHQIVLSREVTLPQPFQDESCIRTSKSHSLVE